MLKKFIFGKNTVSEPEEFVEEYKKFGILYQTLSKVEKHVEAWLELTRQLKDLALEMGETLKIEDAATVSNQMKKREDSEMALAAIKSKKMLLKEVLSLHKTGKKEKEEYNKSAKKLETMQEKKSEQNAGAIESLKMKTEELKKKFESTYENVFNSMKFINSIVPENASISALIKHELNCFRVAQFEHLLGCQKLIRGDVIDLDSIQKTFITNAEVDLYDSRVEHVKSSEKIEETVSKFQDDEDDSDDPTKRLTGLEPVRPKSAVRKNESQDSLQNGPDYLLDKDEDLEWSKVDAMRTSSSEIKKI